MKSLLLFYLLYLQTAIYAQLDSITNSPDLVVKDSIISGVVTVDSLKISDLKKDTVINPGVSPDAVDQVIEYNCTDSILFSLTDEKMFLYGTGDITSKEVKLTSAYVEISTADKYIYSEAVMDSTGLNEIKPVLEQDEDAFTVKNVKYNFKTKQALVEDVKLKQEEGFLHSDIAKMQTNKELHIKGGKFTTCDLDNPHYYIKLTKAKKIPDKQVVSGPMYFVIADIPLYFIGLPFGMLPQQKKNTSGILIPEYGEDANRGFFLREGGYFWAINDYINATVLGEIYSKGSWGLSLKSNFKKNYKYNGGIEIKYNKIQNGEKILPGSFSQNSFWVTGSYNQDGKSNPNSIFSTSLNFGSPGFNTFNAKNIQDYTTTQTSSNISYRWSKPGSIFNFSINVRGTQDTKSGTINVSLPAIAVNMKRIFPFKNIGEGTSKWYKKIGVSVTIDSKNEIKAGDSTFFTRQTLNDMKNGIKYSIPVSTSFTLLHFINVSPSFSLTGRIYSSKILETPILLIEDDQIINSVRKDTVYGFNYPYDFSFSLPLSTKIYGLFNINKGRVKAIRHVMSPSLSFSYRPDFSGEYWGFYGYNQEKNDYYSYYQGYPYGYPPSGKSGSINFSLGNNLEMKLKNKVDSIETDEKIKLIENLTIGTSYNLAADSLNLSPINISGNTKLFKNFGIRASALFNPYADSLGNTINTFELKKNRKLARFENATISLSGSLKPMKTDNSFMFLEDNINYFPFPEIEYTKFDIPWNLSLNYNFRVSNNYDKTTDQYNKEITQTLGVNGNLSLTKNWKLTGNTTYDFSNHKFSYAQFTLYRDLHCWEMSFNVIPFGTLKSYSFRINIKSSVFKGLEYNKRKEWDKSGLFN
jgi:hypothetical protein